MASPAKKTKLDSTAAPRPPCPYGAVCYRKNPAHFKEFSHPGDKDRGETDTPADTTVATAAVGATVLPQCKYGMNCTRKNLLHFAEYSHPYGFVPGGTASTSAPVADDDSDTDVCDSDDEKVNCVPVLY